VPSEHPDIVLVAVDTLRPDHLGCYGYGLPTSPAIDALAAESAVFEQAFAAGIPTTPAFTTMLSGLHPYRHGVVSHPGRRRLDEDVVLLPQLAKAAGYVTVACDNMVVQGGGRGTWFARGYDHYSGFLYTPKGDQSSQITDRALGLAADHRDRPMLMFVHYWDPHTPYGPLPPYDTLHYTPNSGDVDMADVRAIHADYYDAFLADMDLAHPDDYAYVMAQYDGEISQADAQIGRLVEGLRQRGRWDDTVFVLVSDHGECFGDGGLYFDHHGLYDAVTRVALLVRAPWCGPVRVKSLVSHEDLLPTVCDVAGLPLPDYPLTGSSAQPLLLGSAEPLRTTVVSTECSRQASFAWRTEHEKLIVPVTEDVEGRPIPDLFGRPRSAAPMLFDLREDPYERSDLAARRPERVADLRAQLDAWVERELADGRADPLRTQGLSLPYDVFMERRHLRRPAAERAGSSR
jgi:arylsulfatase A-like enzyme